MTKTNMYATLASAVSPAALSGATSLHDPDLAVCDFLPTCCGHCAISRTGHDGLLLSNYLPVALQLTMPYTQHLTLTRMRLQ